MRLQGCSFLSVNAGCFRLLVPQTPGAQPSPGLMNELTAISKNPAPGRARRGSDDYPSRQGSRAPCTCAASGQPGRSPRRRPAHPRACSTRWPVQARSCRPSGGWRSPTSLTVAVRRSRIDVEFRRAALADLAQLDITTDPPHRPQMRGARPCIWPIASGFKDSNPRRVIAAMSFLLPLTKFKTAVQRFSLLGRTL